ncbi:hypothetical protein NDU88_000843 [Pleurodeles waltl]|uniref:Uncharacterized protein n=1 Tax=Pleurodeles waltl TaxID=8319 RepID=A0AAV7SXV2_PLEWA|nr:hypothetical protein NDU88_000843 [Pleurodeles waltl]
MYQLRHAARPGRIMYHLRQLQAWARHVPPETAARPGRVMYQLRHAARPGRAMYYLKHAAGLGVSSTS